MFRRSSLIGLVLSLVLAMGPVAAEAAQGGEPGRKVARQAVLKLAETASAQRLTALGLTGASLETLTVGQPMVGYTFRRSDLNRVGFASWGSLFQATDRSFALVRVKGETVSGVWLSKGPSGPRVDRIGQADLARAIDQAHQKIDQTLTNMDLTDRYEIRLVVLDWAACRLLAVMIRDRVLLWPLPTAARLLKLDPGLYPYRELIPLLTGRTAD